MQVFIMEGVVESLLNGFFRMRRFTKTLTIRMHFDKNCATSVLSGFLFLLVFSTTRLRCLIAILSASCC
jgi:hypothetical protein